MSLWFGLRFVGWTVIGTLCLQAAHYNLTLGTILLFVVFPLLFLAWHWVLQAAEGLYNQREDSL